MAVYGTLLFGKEDSFGVAPSTFDQLFGLVDSFNGGVDEQVETVATINNGREYYYNLAGIRSVSGSMSYEVTSGKELYFAIGTLSDDTSNKTFTITPADDLPSLTIKREVGGVVEIFTGVKFNKLTLKSAVGEVLSADIDFIGRNLTTESGTITPLLDNYPPLIFYNGQIKIDGSAVADVQDFTLDITNDLIPYTDISLKTTGEERLVKALIPKMLGLNLTMSVLFSKDLADKVLSQEDHTVELDFSNSTNTLKVSLTGVRFSSYTSSIQKDADLVKMDLVAKPLSISVSGTYS